MQVNKFPFPHVHFFTLIFTGLDWVAFNKTEKMPTISTVKLASCLLLSTFSALHMTLQLLEK